MNKLFHHNCVKEHTMRQQFLKGALTVVLFCSIAVAKAAPLNGQDGNTWVSQHITVDTLAEGDVGSGSVGEFNLPLVLKTFQASLENNEVYLWWSTGLEKELSHFVIERSLDGGAFEEAGIVMATGNSDMEQQYHFEDPVSIAGNHVLYYRIRMVDMMDRRQNSDVKKIAVSGNGTVLPEVKAYPNPVVAQATLTVPDSWQNNRVTFEVYSNRGLLVKRQVEESAGRINTLDMQLFKPGMYLLKVSSAAGQMSKWIVKN